MKLSEHFSLAEFVASTTAQAQGIDNALPAVLLDEARRTAQMLERIRALLSELRGAPMPLLLSSGYRCPALNRAIGSSFASDHLQAMAADFSAPAFGSPYQVCLALAPQVRALGIGQLIHECPAPGRTWVHVSTRVPDKLANRVITIGRSGPQLGIQEA